MLFVERVFDRTYSLGNDEGIFFSPRSSDEVPSPYVCRFTISLCSPMIDDDQF